MSRTKGAKDKKPRAKSEASTRPRGIIAMQNPELPAGYNSEFIQFATEIMPTEPLDYHDVPEMERRFSRYLQKCQEYDKKPGNLAAYAAIGIGETTVRQWIATEPDSERARFVKKLKDFMAAVREDAMGTGKVNPVVGIFWQKNYDGLHDQQEFVVAPKKEMETVDDRVLQAKYADVIEGEDD